MNKKNSILLLASAAALCSFAQSKFDASGIMALDAYRALQAEPAAVHAPLAASPVDMDAVSRSGATQTVIVRLAEGVTACETETWGFETIADLGEYAILSGSMEAIAGLEDCPLVVAASFGGVAEAHLDKSRAVIGMDDVHSGAGLSQAYTGKGVIAGIYDIGMDPNHANFLDADMEPRVKVVYQYSGSGGNLTQYTTPERIKKFSTDSDADTHGTHTTGCMAGSFNKRGGGKVAILSNAGICSATSLKANPYYGMATGSDIAMGCGPLYLTNVIAGVQKLIKYAETAGKPIVINLSLGSNSGPHDGSDVNTSAINSLAKTTPICVSAGNEGDMNVSIVRKFTATDNQFQTCIYDGQNFSGVADIWSDNATQFDFTLLVVDRSTGKIAWEMPITTGAEKTTSIATSNFTTSSYQHNAVFDNAFSSSYVHVTTALNKSTNNRYSVTINGQISYNRTTNPSKNLVLGFRVKGSNGQRVVACSDLADFYSLDVPGFINGNGEMSINNLACGSHVLSIGAWTARNRWPALNGGVYHYGEGAGLDANEPAGFSSWGTTCDGRQLPLVCAPGTAIVSSISTPYVTKVAKTQSDYTLTLSADQTYNGRSNYWESQQGTSMSSPIVAGSLVTWLEANPNLTRDQIADALKHATVVDNDVTSNGIRAQWGGGKFNALEGLKYILGLGVNDIVADADSRLIVAPAGTNAWEVVVSDAKSVTADLYSMAGVKVATAAAEGNSVTVSTAGLAKGVYVLQANGAHSARIVVK